MKISIADSQSERRLKGLLDVLSIDKKFDSETELHNTIENSVKNLINWDAFTFVYFNPTTQKFVTSKIINKTSLKYVGENLEIDLNETIVGQSILSGSPVLIDDTSSTEFNRFSKSEDVSFDGAFMVIPLIYDEQNYGVLCFESLKKNIYTNEDVRFLKNATKFFAFIVYAYSNQYVLKNLLSVDIETTALNLRTFIERLSADLVKAKGV